MGDASWIDSLRPITSQTILRMDIPLVHLRSARLLTLGPVQFAPISLPLGKRAVDQLLSRFKAAGSKDSVHACRSSSDVLCPGQNKAKS